MNNRTTILNSLPNNQAGFQWQVFSIIPSEKVEIDCDMVVKPVHAPPQAQPLAQPEEAGETTVLVLNGNGNGWRPAVLINPAGNQEKLTCFDKNEATTSAHNSCGINWQNQLHIFGGKGSAKVYT